jgi:hypothetical protein
MSTLGKRPNIGFILDHVGLFRGEEKSLNNEEDPRRMININVIINSLRNVIGWHETPEFCPIDW